MVAIAARMVSAAPAPQPSQEGWWRYVERGRGHEVLARWLGAEGRFLVRETSPWAPGIAFEDAHAVERPWEARLALWLLESRLAQLGEYWRERSYQRGWARIGRPVNAPPLDLRPNEVLDARLVPVAHHYFDAHGGGDTLVAALRAAQAERFVVVRAEMDVPSLDVGRIDVVHPLLPAALVRSVVAREQIGLAQAGLPKLVSRADYERTFGHGGDRRAAKLMDTVATRVRDGALERPPAWARAEADGYEEFLCTLSDPRLLALHHRFLLAGEEDEVLAGGPPAIRKLVAAKRAGSDHHEQHLLTILEASLLARERMQRGRLDRRDPEVRALTRLAYYL